jgi:hypothetical protein
MKKQENLSMKSQLLMIIMQRFFFYGRSVEVTRCGKWNGIPQERYLHLLEMMEM